MNNPGSQRIPWWRSPFLMVCLLLVVAVGSLVVIYGPSIWISHRLSQEQELNRLNEAVKLNAFKLVKLELEQGADVNAHDGYGVGPIHCVGSATMVKMLVRHGANPSLLSRARMSAFHYADDPKVIAALADAGTDPRLPTKGSPFDRVISPAVTKALIDVGFSVNSRRSEYQKPLSVALDHGRLDIAEVLLDAGAVPGDAYIPFIKSGEAVELLTRYGRDFTADYLYATVRDDGSRTSWVVDRWERIGGMLDGGIDVDSLGKDGMTALHQCYDLRTAKLLIDRGADVNLRDKFGKAPLHYPRHAEITNLLIASGADVNLRTFSGDTPLDLVSPTQMALIVEVLRGAGGMPNDDPVSKFEPSMDVEAVRDLLDAGEEPSGWMSCGGTLLHRTGSVEIAKLLLERGADLHAQLRNFQPPEGVRMYWWRALPPLTALHTTPSAEVAKLLVERGIGVDAAVGRWASPIYYTPSVDVSKFLVEAGANLGRGKFRPRSPLHTTPSVDVARYLVEECGVAFAADKISGENGIHRNWSLEVVRYLIELGCDPHKLNDEDMRPLATNRSMEVLRFLLSLSGSDPMRPEGKFSMSAHSVNPALQELMKADFLKRTGGR